MVIFGLIGKKKKATGQNPMQTGLEPHKSMFFKPQQQWWRKWLVSRQNRSGSSMLFSYIKPIGETKLAQVSNNINSDS